LVVRTAATNSREAVTQATPCSHTHSGDRSAAVEGARRQQ
jgi:hypothetical protein